MAVVDTDVPNAFATGRNQDNAVVCVTTGLLRRLDTTELANGDHASAGQRAKPAVDAGHQPGMPVALRRFDSLDAVGGVGAEKGAELWSGASQAPAREMNAVSEGELGQ